MDVVDLLEILAESTDFTINLPELIATQPREIQRCFCMNDSKQLKKLLSNTTINYDRSTIFSL